MARLNTDFYSQQTLDVAKSLLGCKLVVAIRSSDGTPYRCSGIIVETEAYLDRDDPACHASRGMTRRNEVMFGPPGILYVYTIHNRCCSNIVTQKQGQGAAVLIRAIQPVDGIGQMKQHRPLSLNLSSQRSLIELGNGPGKLCQSLGIDLKMNGLSLLRSEQIWVEDSTWRDFSISCTPRIGISQGRELPYRFFIDGNRFVSGKASDHQRKRDCDFPA